MIIRGGKVICDKCGVECTPLQGFQMAVRPDAKQDQRVMKIVDEIEKDYGQSDFIFCWRCTVEAFGIKPKGDIDEEEIKEETKQDDKPKKKDK